MLLYVQIKWIVEVESNSPFLLSLARDNFDDVVNRGGMAANKDDVVGRISEMIGMIADVEAIAILRILHGFVKIQGNCACIGRVQAV